jgi:hypothetical protein
MLEVSRDAVAAEEEQLVSNAAGQRKGAFLTTRVPNELNF